MSGAAMTCTAVLADDEPWLRADLREQLAAAWPELVIVEEVGDGLGAVAAVQRLAPDVVFLDVQMPRLGGLEAASRLKGEVEIVFLTAYDRYALDAFGHRAADYLLKPLDAARLADTVARLRERLRERRQARDVATQLRALAGELRQPASSAALDWIRVAVGNATRLIRVSDVMAFRAVTGYTEVVTRDADALIRTPLRDLLPRLDPAIFVQVHRNAIVNLGAVAMARRLPDGRFAVDLRNGRATIETSRSRAALFRED